MVQQVRLMIFSQHMVYYHMSFLLFYAWNSNLFDVFCPIVINWVTGKIIVILNVDQIVPEDSLIKLKIGDGEHWWFPVHLGPQMFQYYRHGWYIRGRQFKILESYMQDDTIVIVSDITQSIYKYKHYIPPQTNMILYNPSSIIPNEHLMMIPVTSKGLFQERRKTTKTGNSILTWCCTIGLTNNNEPVKMFERLYCYLLCASKGYSKVKVTDLDEGFYIFNSVSLPWLWGLK